MHTFIKTALVTLTIFSCSQIVLAHAHNHKDKKPDPHAIMERMDNNGDGKLSKKEVKGPLKDHFKMVDANHDGFITLEELRNPHPPKHKPQQ